MSGYDDNNNNNNNSGYNERCRRTSIHRRIDQLDLRLQRRLSPEELVLYGLRRLLFDR